MTVAVMWEARAAEGRGADLLAWAEGRPLGPERPLRRETLRAPEDRVLVITWWDADYDAELPELPDPPAGLVARPVHRWRFERADSAQPSWYGVRCVFRHVLQGHYEERVTLWTARSLDEAIERGEREAAEYCADLDGVEYVRFAEAYAMADDGPDEGAEVFSLLRESTLPPGEYVSRYFATGAERASGA